MYAERLERVLSMKAVISPSVLAGDFSKLGEEIKRLDAAGADRVHLDVMDGHFVPNISFGAPVIKAVRGCTGLCFDVHLMISEPLRYLDDFVKAGADMITFHLECDDDAAKTLEAIKAAGLKAGLALKPATLAKAAGEYLGLTDSILVMTVEPGFGGQKFMPETLPKMRELREMIEREGSAAEIAVDGGIDLNTIGLAAAAGASAFVAGSAVFRAEDMAETIAALREAAV